MSSTRWSMGTCSNEVDSSTRFELEDSMNPLQAVAFLAHDSLCGYNQGCLFLMIRGFNPIWTNTVSLYDSEICIVHQRTLNLNLAIRWSP